MKDVGKKLKDDAGYALVYTLGAILLISMLMMGIFMHARNNYVQIEAVDRMTKMKDIKEFALQEASAKLKDSIREKISANQKLGNGRSKAEDVANLKPNMLEAAAELSNKFKQSGIGKDKEFSYEVTIDKNPTVVATNEVYEYMADKTSGENGWVKRLPNEELAEVTNTKTTFKIEVKVTRTQKNGKVTTNTDNAEYVYEFQWEKRKYKQSNGQTGNNQSDIQKMDTWRYVYYEAPLSNGEEYISADAWVRKMDRIYHYQNEPLDFPFRNKLTPQYNPSQPAVYGYSWSKYLVDYSDAGFGPISFWDRRNTEPISSTLTFEGSFLLDDGVALKGKSDGHLIVKNLLGLNNHKNYMLRQSAINDLSITAGTGIFIDQTIGEKDLAHYDDQIFIIDNEEEKEIKTPNLLINHTGYGYVSLTDAANPNGFNLAKGNILIEKGTSSVNFAEYGKDVKLLNPQDEKWDAFMEGGFVIAGSQVNLTPLARWYWMNLDYGIGTSEIHDVLKNTEAKDPRTIRIKDGNFMLTSASMTNGKGEEDFSYMEKGTFGSKPREPSLLSLSGENTSLVVENGVSFIDSPKTKKRTSYKTKGSYFNNSKYWNTIRLKDKSQLDLGTVGVEPFNLETEEDTKVTMKLLPELVLFDTIFIEKGFKKGTESINGKLILKTATVEDANKLYDDLKKNSDIKVSVKSNEDDAINGEVTIVTPTVPISTTSGWVTQRVFEYSEVK